MGRKEGWLLGLSAVLSNRHCGAFDVTQLSSFLERWGDGGPGRRCDWLKVAQLSGWWQSHILTAPCPLAEAPGSAPDHCPCTVSAPLLGPRPLPLFVGGCGNGRELPCSVIGVLHLGPEPCHQTSRNILRKKRALKGPSFSGTWCPKVSASQRRREATSK